LHLEPGWLENDYFLIKIQLKTGQICIWSRAG